MELFSLPLVGITFTACKKTENAITDFRPAELGQLHNQYLEEAIALHYKNQELSIREVLLKLDVEQLTINQKEHIYDEICLKSNSEKFKSISAYLSSPNIIYFHELNRLIDELRHYDVFDRELNLLSNKIKLNVDGDDRQILLGILETTRYSSQFWLPEELGGFGKGDQYLSDNNIHIVPGAVSGSHKEIIRADGLGAGVGMVGWAVSGIFVPIVGPLGIIPATVYGAVIASLMEGGKTGWGSSSGCIE